MTPAQKQAKKKSAAAVAKRVAKPELTDEQIADNAARYAESSAAEVERAQLKVKTLMAAQADWAALKAWTKAGEVGERPSTAALDAFNEAHVGYRPGEARARRVSARKTRVERAPRTDVDVVFYVDGTPWREHRLSGMAYKLTPRMTTEELRDILKAAAVIDWKTEWVVKLPSGQVLSTKVNGSAADTAERFITREAPAVAKAMKEPKPPKAPVTKKAVKVAAKKSPTKATKKVTPKPVNAKANGLKRTLPMSDDAMAASVASELSKMFVARKTTKAAAKSGR